MKNSLASRVVLLAIFALSAINLSGQDSSSRFLKTSDYQVALLNDFPEVGNKISEIERAINQPGFTPDSMGPITIPIVFHVLSGLLEQPISREMIQSQIDALNRDFAENEMEVESEGGEVSEGENQSNFYREYDRLDLRFCYANVLDGGVNYILNPLEILGVTNDIKNSALGGAAPLNPEQFINIWVVDLPESVAGYAQMPGGPLSTDGIVIDRDFFGQTNEENPYGEGKTLTHLIGNYLGLNDLWNKHHCGDDGVRDTPIHNAPNFGCSGRGKHVSLCPGNPVEMTMNFMDNSFDRCTYMFTRGQKDRILAMLSVEGARSGLLNGAVLCESQLDPIEETFPEAKVEDDLKKPFILLLPNPASRMFTIEISNKPDLPTQMVVYSTSGRVMQNRQLPAGRFIKQDISCVNWPSGIYIVSVRLEDSLYTKRIVIN